MRAHRPLVVLCVVAALAGCKKRESTSAVTTTTTAASATVTTSSAATAAVPEVSLVSLGAGGVVAQKPQEESDGYGAFRLIDENPSRGWSTPDGVTSQQTMVFSLPGHCELSRAEFDTDGLKPGRAAKDVTIEVSDTSAGAGFTKVGAVSLAESKNQQSFPLSPASKARWIRLTVLNNHGDKDNIELMDFRAYGKALDRSPVPSLTGDFTSNMGDMQLRQDGASVVGCYGKNGGKLIGGIDGRTLKVQWSDASGNSGTAVVNISDDGKEFFGLMFDKGDVADGSIWSGNRATEKIEGCGLTAGSAQEEMAGDLEKSGRTRVYGILFDTDSATIKPESKATLDDITAVMKAHGDWTLVVEGHTDSTGGDAHNQQLSEQRAASVKSYLVNAGIPEARLKPQGFGATKPVAPNDTELGRAQNRRVELAKG